jgi:hypothetical protein
MEKGKGTVTLDGLDLFDVMNLSDKKMKKFIALTLQELEQVEDLSPEQFKMIRKLILDGFNEYTRSLLRALLGDVEVAPYVP